MCAIKNEAYFSHIFLDMYQHLQIVLKKKKIVDENIASEIWNNSSTHMLIQNKSVINIFSFSKSSKESWKILRSILNTLRCTAEWWNMQVGN